MARDRGAVPYMDFGTVDVTVLDRNDKIPVFISVSILDRKIEKEVRGLKPLTVM